MPIIAYDLGTDQSGDLVIQNGDFTIADSNKEHAASIIDANKGEYRQTPSLGVEINRYLNSSNSTILLSQAINQQLSDDGFLVDDLEITYDIKTNSLMIKTNAQRLR